MSGEWPHFHLASGIVNIKQSEKYEGDDLWDAMLAARCSYGKLHSLDFAQALN